MTDNWGGSAGEAAEEFLFVHAVLESFAAVDEDDGDFVGVTAADFGVGLDVDFAPGETAALFEFGEALFDDFAEMASLARVKDDLAPVWHAGSVAGETATSY
jgi:hypothetical protein